MTFRMEQVSATRKIRERWEYNRILQEHGIDSRATLCEWNRRNVSQVFPRLAAFFGEKTALEWNAVD